MKNILTTLALAFTILSVSGQPFLAQDYLKGGAAYWDGDYQTALQEWRPLAEQGHAGAQHNLAQMYRNGSGVTQDYAEAAKWYRKAAEQGGAGAQYDLALMYHRGDGVTQDYAEALKWFRKAAGQEHREAQYNLAVIYRRGDGVTVDNVYAHMWFSIAAAQGYGVAKKASDFVAKTMTEADISKAQKLARECVKKNYKGC